MKQLKLLLNFLSMIIIKKRLLCFHTLIEVTTLLDSKRYDQCHGFTMTFVIIFCFLKALFLVKFGDFKTKPNKVIDSITMSILTEC